jgi:transmembrane sensor
MDISRFYFLMDQAEKKQASPGEKAELLGMFGNETNRETIDQLIMDMLAEAPADESLNMSRFKPVIDRILEKESSVVSISAQKANPFAWIAVAASVIAVIFGIYYFTNRSNTTQPTIVVVQDVMPGANRATLTLGNGKTILLDSVHKGAIVLQGNVNIIKTDSGQLAYLPSTVNRQLPTNNTLTTPRGGQYQVTLADGTKVWLNAASSITYPTAFTGKERKVSITGEAYFEVVHNDAQPFTVTVNGIDVRDIGTHFDINAYSDESQVVTTIMEGKVKLVKGSESVVLKPGQQARVKSKIQVIDQVNTDQAVAWKEGYFDFQDTKLDAAMRQLSRWYDIEVVYDKGIPDIKFGGSLRQDLPLSSLLKLLEGAKVHFSIESNRKLIVLP